MNTTTPDSSQRKAQALLVSVLALALLTLAAPSCGKVKEAQARASMAESVSNGRQVKLIMDSFAMDNDGKYPSAESASLYSLPSPKTSNDYFRQLFASGNTNSEKIFWNNQSKFCNKAKPDDLTSDSAGQFSAAETLKPGDNAWAYVENQTNTDNPDRPILFDAPLAGVTFDPDLWDGKAIVVRIDGSARPERLNAANQVLDKDNTELLSSASKVWDGTTPTIAYPDKP